MPSLNVRLKVRGLWRVKLGAAIVALGCRIMGGKADVSFADDEDEVKP